MNKIQTHIYKRKHRSGNVSWMVRWKDRDTGAWRTATAGRDEDEARAVEAQIRDNLLRGVDPNPKSQERQLVLVNDLIEEFLQSPRFLTASEKWQKVVRSQMESVIKKQFGNQKITELKKDKIFKVYLQMKVAGFSHATIKKYHFKLSILGDLYCELNPGAVNPIRFNEEFDRLFPPQASSRDINFLTPSETQRVLPEILNPIRRSNSVPLVYSFCRFLSVTGLRRSEAHDLKHTDIDRETGFILVRDSKTGESRMVPLEPEAWDAIKDLPRCSEYVFVMKDGKRRHPDSFLVPLQKAAKRAGISKRIDLHTLRHSYGSNKLRAGWGLRKVSQLLGHSDIRITAEVYAHLLDGDLKVRDEFHFDNHVERENIELSKKGNFDVSQAIQNLISALEAAPQGELLPGKIAVTLKHAFQLPSDMNSAEPISAIDLQETPSSATLLLRRPEMDESMPEIKKASESELLHNIAGLISTFEWRTRLESNQRPSASEADTLSN